MVSLEYLKKQVMLQAKKKGFGTKPADIIIAEKIALIHSEISEAYDAYLKKNLKNKDGFYEEMGDVLQRVLHLMGIYKIKLPKVSIKAGKKKIIERSVANLHKITSEAWENYRKKRTSQFKKNLQSLVILVIQTAKEHKFSVEEAVLKKISSNIDRKWNKKKLNEKFN